MGCKIFKIKSNNDQKQQDNIPIQKTKVLVNTYGTQNCQNKVKKQDVFSQVQNCLKLKYQDPAILYVIERIPHGMSSYGQVSKGYNRITLEQRLFKKISVKNIELEEQQKFIKEIIRLSQLDHANIPKICDFYYYEDYFILVTASLDGEELFDFIVNNGQCHETLAAIIVKQILTTIIYCHQQNIIHKDLKPENIYIDKQNDESLSIKVIDFGTSLHFNRKREDMGNFGTPYYLAPEVFKRNSSFKRDIWSLGVILYILLCGTFYILLQNFVASSQMLRHININY